MLRSAVAILFILLLFSCKKNVDDNHHGNIPSIPPSSGPGVIGGKVKYYNQYGEEITSPMTSSTINVTGDGAYTTLTDSSGNYQVSISSAGFYKMLFSHQNFSAWKSTSSFQCCGTAEAVTNATLVEAPTYTFSSINVRDSHLNIITSRIYVSGTVTPFNKSRGIAVIGIDIPRIPNIDSMGSFKFFELITIPANTSTFGVLGTGTFNNDTVIFNCYPHAPVSQLSYTCYSPFFGAIPAHGPKCSGNFTITFH